MNSQGDDEFERTIASQSAGGPPYAGTGTGSQVQSGTMVGDYEVLELIGRGGMGYVYKVRHRILEKVYAMKTMSPEMVTENAWGRFQNEAKAIARMSHPNIVGIHNLGMHEGQRPYYVMDFLEGDNLADFIDEEGPLNIDAVIAIFVEVAKGLEYAHKKGIIHRDIKPGNIVILNKVDVTGARVKLVDFGIAKLSQATEQANQNLTTVGEIFGSPLYMSPEQCQGQRIDARSDNYSLGCTLFEALTGSPPFKESTPLGTMLAQQSKPAPTLASVGGKTFPDALEKIVAKLLKKEPMDRYQNLDLLAQDLIAVGRPLPMHEPPPDPRPDKLKILAILATALIITGMAIAIFMNSGTLTDTHKETVVEATKKGESSGTTTDGTTDGTTNGTTSSSGKSTASSGSTPTAVLPPLTEKFSEIRTDKNKVKFKIFHFPADRSLGYIRLEDDTREFYATETQKFPIDKRLHFVANQTMMADPNNFDLISDGDFTGIYLNDQAESNVAPSVNSSIPAPEPVDADITSALKHMKHLKSLQELRLRNCLQLKDEDILLADQFPHLTQLDFTDCNADGRTVAKLNCLKQLYELNITGCLHASAAVNAVAGSKELAWLTLNAPREPLTHADIKAICTCSNLRQLDLDRTGIDNACIKTISSLKKLRSLYAGSNLVDCKAIADLISMPALSVFRLAGKSWGPECTKKLLKAAPRMKDAEADGRQAKIFTL